MKENFYFRCCVSFILPLDVIILFKLWCRKKERGGTEKKNHEGRGARCV